MKIIFGLMLEVRVNNTKIMEQNVVVLRPPPPYHHVHPFPFNHVHSLRFM